MLVSGHTLSNIVNPGSASCRLAHCDHRWQMKVCPAGAYCGCTGSGERRKQAEKTDQCSPQTVVNALLHWFDFIAVSEGLLFLFLLSLMQALVFKLFKKKKKGHGL